MRTEKQTNQNKQNKNKQKQLKIEIEFFFILEVEQFVKESLKHMEDIYVKYFKNRNKYLQIRKKKYFFSPRKIKIKPNPPQVIIIIIRCIFL